MIESIADSTSVYADATQLIYLFEKPLTISIYKPQKNDFTNSFLKNFYPKDLWGLDGKKTFVEGSNDNSNTNTPDIDPTNNILLAAHNTALNALGFRIPTGTIGGGIGDNVINKQFGGAPVCLKIYKWNGKNSK